MKKLYQCRNKSCSLGDAHNPGHFTGGISKEQVTALTGDPEPEKDQYGQGVCPVCATPGTEVDPGGDD